MALGALTMKETISRLKKYGIDAAAQWYAESKGQSLEEAKYIIASHILNEYNYWSFDKDQINLSLCRYFWQKNLTDEQVADIIRHAFRVTTNRIYEMQEYIARKYNLGYHVERRLTTALCVLFPGLYSNGGRLSKLYFEDICHQLGVTMDLDSPEEPEEVMYTLPQDNSSEEYETYTLEEFNEELGKLIDQFHKDDDEQEEEYYDDECDEEEWTLADYLDEMNELADKRLAELKGEYVEEEEEEEGPYAFLGEDYEDYTLGSRSEEWYNFFSADSASDSFTDYGVGAFGAFGYGGDGDGDGDGD